MDDRRRLLISIWITAGSVLLSVVAVVMSLGVVLRWW